MGMRGRSKFTCGDHTFFVTTTVVEHAEVFSCGDQYFDILANSLLHMLTEHQTLLRAYVFMPSHIHLVLDVPSGENISNLMRDFKKYTSTKVRQQLQREGNTRLLQVLRQHARGKKNQIFKLWMDRFDDVVIRDEKMLVVKVEYIHNNPVKAALVSTPEDWKYSSAGDYLGKGPGPLPVATDWFKIKGRLR